jgi:hypothetical protein
MPSDLLESMRRNPAGDWRIQDVEVWSYVPFRKGYFAYPYAAPRGAGNLTIPARRPIKPVYIRKLVRYIDTYGGSR